MNAYTHPSRKQALPAHPQPQAKHSRRFFLPMSLYRGTAHLHIWHQDKIREHKSPGLSGKVFPECCKVDAAGLVDPRCQMLRAYAGGDAGIPRSLFSLWLWRRGLCLLALGMAFFSTHPGLALLFSMGGGGYLLIGGTFF